MRGFISGVAIVILIEQLIPELGLEALAKETGAAHSSAWQKAIFVKNHVLETHLLTFYIGLGAFIILVSAKCSSFPIQVLTLFCRALKTHAQVRYKKNWVSLIPDILTVVAFSACKASVPNFLY